MAFPVLESTNKGQTASGTSHSMNLPTGIQAGDFLIIFWVNAGSSANYSAPAGWSAPSRLTFGSGTRDSWFSRRVADGTEGSSVTMTSSNSTNSGYMSLRISNSNNQLERTPQASEITGTSTNPNPPSLSPSWGAEDYLWIAYTCINDDNTFSVYPTDYSNGDYQFGGTSKTIAYATRQLNASSEDPGTFTMSASDAWSAITIAVRGLPDIETNAVSDIKSLTAICNGQFNINAYERGFVYSTSTHSDPGDTSPEDSDYESFKSNNGSFNSPETLGLLITPLIEETQYYVRAFTRTLDGTYIYGDEVNFTTLELLLPTITTDAVSNIEDFSARGNGEITDDGNDNIAEVGFVISTSTQDDPGNNPPSESDYELSNKKIGNFGEETYSISLTDLDSDTQYFVRAYAKNNAGYSYGDEVNFTTEIAKPIIESIDPPGALIDTVVNFTIHGRNFKTGATIEIDGEACTDVEFVDSETITADCPIGTEQKLAILVLENPDGQQAFANFYYMDVVPSQVAQDSVRAKFTVEKVYFN